MAKYITISDLIDRFGALELVELTSDRTEGVVSPEDLENYAAQDPSLPPSGEDTLKVVSVIEAAIADAESAADSYLQAHYVLPLDEAKVTNALKAKVSDLARYELYVQGPTVAVRQRYEDSVRWFELLSRSLVQIGVDAEDESPGRTGGPAVMVASTETHRVFTAHKLRNYIDPV